MADPFSHHDTDDSDVGPGRGSAPGTPRWVQVFGVITLILVLLVVIVMIAGDGSHGPGRHTPSSDAGGYAGSTAHSLQQR